jgi:hypothetical protein
MEFSLVINDANSSWIIYYLMAGQQMNNELESIWKEAPMSYWRDCVKPRKISVTVANVPDELRTDHHLNVSLE